MEGKAKSNGGSRVLYHIGKRPAQPEKKRAGWRGVGQDDSDWVRPWLDSPVPKAVFLTSNPILVSLNHGISGHVYAYEVPRWVIKKAQGIHRYDRASEVLIPDTLWKHVKFLGKSMEKDKLYEKAAQYDDSAYNKHREEEGAKRRKRQWSPSSRAAFLRAEWEDDDGEAKFNPRGSDIYDPREEQLRAQRQAIYESSLLRDEPQLKFKTFRNAKGERLDQHVIEEGDFPWLQKYIGKKMFRIGVGVQKRDRRLKRKDGYLSLTAKTIGESKRRYADVDKLVRNRQDYEESLALMRKSSFYRVTKEPTRDGWVYFVWPMQPGQRIPKGFSSKKRAENVANLANRDAPTVGGAWWKPPKKKYTKRELGHWLPPADIWRSK